MKRRQFILLLGGAAAAWPLAARAQQAERVRRIGVLIYQAADDAEGQARLAAFTQALKQLGWSDGRNLRIDTRWATAEGILRRHAPNWSRSRRTSWWLRAAPQTWRRCCRQPAP